MRRDLPARSRRALVAAAALCVAVVVVRSGLGEAARAPYRPPPLSREARDLGVACLAEGVVEPPIAELSDEDLDAIVAILARLIAAYERADFDSFLALRVADLECAGSNEALREPIGAFCRELGVRDEDIPEDWLGRLGVYWRAYYAEPPVRAFLPERSVVRLHEEEVGRLPDRFEETFDALALAHVGGLVRHRLVVPHCHELARIAAEARPLRWLDLELAFEPQDLGLGWLIARFVWDGCEEEWFLHRATTVLDGERRDDRRHLVL